MKQFGYSNENHEQAKRRLFFTPFQKLVYVLLKFTGEKFVLVTISAICLFLAIIILVVVVPTF